MAGDWAGKAGGQIFFGAISGGVGAELTGGNFWQGAFTGGIVAGLNHAMHKMGGPLDDGVGDPKNKKKGFTTNKQNDDKVRKANEASSYGEAASELIKEGLISVREAMPLSKKIGSFKTFSKYYKLIKTTSNGIGYFSNFSTGAVVLLDVNDYFNHDISGGVLIYRTIGAVAGVAGSSIGGPVVGTSIGVTFSIGEKLLNNVAIMMNRIENNNLYWLYNLR